MNAGGMPGGHKPGGHRDRDKGHEHPGIEMRNPWGGSHSGASEGSVPCHRTSTSNGGCFALSTFVTAAATPPTLEPRVAAPDEALQDQRIEGSRLEFEAGGFPLYAFQYKGIFQPRRGVIYRGFVSQFTFLK